MHLGTHRLTWAGAAVLGALTLALQARAQDADRAALAAALKDVPTTLEQGLRASEKTGKPISAKFELDEGKLQLSIYTMMGDGYSGYTEVLVSPDNGAVRSAEKITDPDDLKDATAQKAAMDKATVSLITATEQALQQNTGSRAVSIFADLKGGHPVAAVTLLRGGQFTTVSEKLD
jgi:hypothetical protein